MNESSPYIFYGDQQRRLEQAHPDAPQFPEPYIASDELTEAVNLAIYLKRPLLLEGEAGCGKTRLARAVAYELGLPLYTWYVRSTSKAQEGLYDYDAILRLHDVQIQQMTAALLAAGSAIEPGKDIERDPRNPKDYRRWGPLGQAFALEECPAVVLIDEVDKADIDFPNDLLTVLDDPWEFAIPETRELIRARHKPIVIITSNKEKGNLPAPFLRRCIYYFVNFPDKDDQLKKIVEAHYQTRPESARPAAELVAAAIQRFQEMRAEGTGLHKKPGTSEFLDWLEALHNFETPRRHRPKVLPEGPIPYPGLLFKLRADWRRYANQ